jgi:hypothetical protein
MVDESNQLLREYVRDLDALDMRLCFCVAKRCNNWH